uniref:Uncharacterized protein n=1 Tax=Octopus bimaculoides TaxID=37653 RepID=A0A0L8IF21_OCTBM
MCQSWSKLNQFTFPLESPCFPLQVIIVVVVVKPQNEEKQDRLYELSNDIPKNTMRHANSRRGSDDSSEEGTREIKSQLNELEDKYKKAMVGSAQLHNEKQALVYEVDLLKDQVEEQEEEVIEYQRQFKDKCKELESKKRSYQDLENECKTAKYQLEERDKVIRENGLAIVISEEGVWSLVKMSSPNGPLSAGIPSLDIDSKLSHDVDSSLGTRNLSHQSVSDNIKAATEISAKLTETVDMLPSVTIARPNYCSVGVQVNLDSIGSEQKQSRDRFVPMTKKSVAPNMAGLYSTGSSVDICNTITSSPGLYVCHKPSSQSSNGRSPVKEFDVTSTSISEEEDEFFDAINMSERGSVSSPSRSVPVIFESSVDEGESVDNSIVSADSLSSDILYSDLRVSSVDPEPEEAPLVFDTGTPSVVDQKNTSTDDNNSSIAAETYLDENCNPALLSTDIQSETQAEQAESDEESVDFLPSYATYKDLDEDGQSTDIEYLKDDDNIILDKSLEEESSDFEQVDKLSALTASGKIKTGYVYKSVSDTNTDQLLTSDKHLPESMNYETAISGDSAVSSISKPSLQESITPDSVDTQKPTFSVNPYETYIGGEPLISDNDDHNNNANNDNNNFNDLSSDASVLSNNHPNEANHDKISEMENKEPQCSEQQPDLLMEGSGLAAAVEESSSLVSGVNIRDSLGEATTVAACENADITFDDLRGDDREDKRFCDRISVEGGELRDSVSIGDIESHQMDISEVSIEPEPVDVAFHSRIEQYTEQDEVFNASLSPETLKFSPGVTFDKPPAYPVSNKKLDIIQEATVSNLEFEEDEEEEGGGLLKYTDDDLFEILDSAPSPIHEAPVEKPQEVPVVLEGTTESDFLRSPSQSSLSDSRNRLSSDLSDPGSPFGDDGSQPHPQEHKTKKAHGSKKLFDHFKSWKKKDKKDSVVYDSALSLTESSHDLNSDDRMSKSRMSIDSSAGYTAKPYGSTRDLSSTGRRNSLVSNGQRSIFSRDSSPKSGILDRRASQRSIYSPEPLSRGQAFRSRETSIDPRSGENAAILEENKLLKEEVCIIDNLVLYFYHFILEYGEVYWTKGVKKLTQNLEEERSKKNVDNHQMIEANGPEMQLYEIQREASKQIHEYKLKLQKAEQDIATLEGSVNRLDSQVRRYKSDAEDSEKLEDELKQEKRKLVRETGEPDGYTRLQPDLAEFLQLDALPNANHSERPYVWRQDSAPCHTSRRTQSWLSHNFCNHITPNIWPPNSPDCNSLHCYVWGAVERDTNKTPCNTKNELKARIMAAFTKLNTETVQKSWRFQSRLEAILKPMAI